jgi:hypothetical protein
MRPPEVIFVCDLDGEVAGAVCSSCGEWMTESGTLFPTVENAIWSFLAEFKSHIETKHIFSRRRRNSPWQWAADDL